FLFLFLSKENRSVLKNINFYISLFLPGVILGIILLSCKFTMERSITCVSKDVLFFSRLSPQQDISCVDVALQFIGSQLIFYNSVLTYIYKDILIDIVFKYLPFVKYYAFIILMFLVLIYSHLLYLYKKTKQMFFLLIFCFSIVILFSSIIWSFIIFPVEYCAKVSFVLIYIYVTYLFSKNILSRAILVCFIIFGLYISLINPIYSLYGYDSLSPSSIIKKIRNPYDFKKDKLFKILDFYSEDIIKNSAFIVHLENYEFYIYYLEKSKYDFRILFCTSITNYFFNQNIKDLDGRNCFVFINSDSEWFQEQKKQISSLSSTVFEQIYELDKEVFLCKKFNYEKYKEHYSGCHYELQYN
ncbi:MAG: hypothetical protein IKN42_07415, partial [Elusimicrobia bacterium]|nr:hypothetical protein [Elusimicrobiota bacterium]